MIIIPSETHAATLSRTTLLLETIAIFGKLEFFQHSDWGGASSGAWPVTADAREMAAGLHGVPRTLVISLLTRHLASRRPSPIISGPAASALIGQLGLSHLGRDWSFRAVEVGTA